MADIINIGNEDNSITIFSLLGRKNLMGRNTMILYHGSNMSVEQTDLLGMGTVRMEQP